MISNFDTTYVESPFQEFILPTNWKAAAKTLINATDTLANFYIENDRPEDIETLMTIFLNLTKDAARTLENIQQIHAQEQAKKRGNNG